MSRVASQGRLRFITGTDPAAGANVLETVTAERRWLLHAIAVSLTTDATVANRIVRLQIQNPDGTVILESEDAAAQAASTTVRYSFGNWGFNPTSPRMALPLPILLPPGARIVTSTAALQVGDNFGAPLLLVEDWDNNLVTGV